MAELNWQSYIFWLGLLGGAATFAVQLGSTQTYVQDTKVNVSVLQVEHKELERTVARLLASQIEQDRRLGAIETHDVETRNVESKLGERLSKLEGQVK